MMDYMPMLRGAGVGAFRYLRDDPPFREIALPLTPVETHDMEWQDGVAHATKMYGYVTFALPRDIHVAGIRLDYTYLNRNRVVPFLGLYWKSSDEADFGEESHLNYYPIGDRANWRHDGRHLCSAADKRVDTSTWAAIPKSSYLPQGHSTVFDPKQ